LMLGIDLVAGRTTKAPLGGAAEAIFKGCVERGVIVRPVGSRIILSPPLVVDKAECDTIIAAIMAASQDYMTGATHA
jgi:putrescine---pyruvate transaminase